MKNVHAIVRFTFAPQQIRAEYYNKESGEFQSELPALFFSESEIDKGMEVFKDSKTGDFFHNYRFFETDNPPFLKYFVDWVCDELPHCDSLYVALKRVQRLIHEIRIRVYRRKQAILRDGIDAIDKSSFTEWQLGMLPFFTEKEVKKIGKGGCNWVR